MESGGSNLIRHTPVDPYMATINDQNPNEKRTGVTEFKSLRKLFLQKSGNLLIGSTGVVTYLKLVSETRTRTLAPGESSWTEDSITWQIVFQNINQVPVIRTPENVLKAVQN